jgi:NADH:ubiquinone oxidoreductase subunit F (NADH-binding)
VNDKPLKAILCGGASSGFLTEEHLDIPLDYKSLFPYGSSLGSGAIMVFAEGVNIVEIVRKNAEFFVHESCGVCVPCRIGGSQIYKILTEFVLKKAKREDVDLLLDLANTVKALSRCGLGQASPNPVITSINLFREDYLSLVE